MKKEFSLRIIESAGFYYPNSSGGTEVYVSSLAKNLKMHGIECIVAAPSQSKEASRYDHEGVAVFRYPVPQRWSRYETQGRKKPWKFDVFEDWLRDQRADIYHQHSWTTGCGLWHLKAAKRLGIKTVVTVHVPANVCMRGTMLYEGRAACDGKIVPERCASCWLQSKGIAAGAARTVAKLPQRLAPLMRLPRLGPVLAAKALAVSRKNGLQEMVAEADRIVAVCAWLYDALLANDVPPGKLVLNRQGAGEGTKFKPLSRMNDAPNVFRFGFLGRWDAVKGVHILVEAFKRVPADLQVELHICGTGTGTASEKYRCDVQRAAACDQRIQFLPAAAHEKVGAFLAGVEALTVPSQWMETGPLVVLEAFAARTPVIGSDLGGIKELVSHGHDGLLVAHDDVSAWTAAMVRLATDRALLQRMRQGIGPVRTMSDVSHDMAMLYQEVCAVDTYAT